jgi:hypothetical protein
MQQEMKVPSTRRSGQAARTTMRTATKCAPVVRTSSIRMTVPLSLWRPLQTRGVEKAIHVATSGLVRAFLQVTVGTSTMCPAESAANASNGPDAAKIRT